jgi:DNA topoisomerase-1
MKTKQKQKSSKKQYQIYSAGRCQSPALFLIYERNEEIENFKPEEYYVLKLLLEKDNVKFNAERIFKNQDIKNIPNIENKYNQTKKIKVIDVKKSKKKELPPPPYETQTAISSITKTLKLKPNQAMSILQKLYEQGLITYHRTDSTRLSNEGIDLAKKIIDSIDKTLFEKHAGKAGTQDYHEAIRITSLKPDLSNLNETEKKVFNIIKDRFLVSQMRPMIYESTKVILEDNFISMGKIILDAGYISFAKNKTEDVILPALNKNDECAINNIERIKKFTQPPAHYNVSTLIADLKYNGIGRPSTYSYLIDTLFKRNYIVEDKGKLLVTDIGKKVIKYLYEDLKISYIDVNYTKEMEKQLDVIAHQNISKEEIISWLSEVYNSVYSDNLNIKNDISLEPK